MVYDHNRERIAFASENRVWFHFIDDFKKIPASLSNNPRDMHQLKDMKWSLGYRGMCRFRSGTMFTHPVMKSYEYAMTLDTDGYFSMEVPIDPIQEMYEGNYLYSFSHVLHAQPGVNRHFWPTTLMYMAMHNIHPIGSSILQDFINHDRLEWNNHLYMNDIEIVDLRFFGDPNGAYQDYFRFLDSMNGSWLYRWGNNEVRTLAVGMFIPRERVYKMNIPYGHQGYCKCIDPEHRCETEGKGNNSSPQPVGEEHDPGWYVCSPREKTSKESEIRAMNETKITKAEIKAVDETKAETREVKIEPVDEGKTTTVEKINAIIEQYR